MLSMLYWSATEHSVNSFYFIMHTTGTRRQTCSQQAYPLPSSHQPSTSSSEKGGAGTGWGRREGSRGHNYTKTKLIVSVARVTTPIIVIKREELVQAGQAQIDALSWLHDF